MQALWSKLQGLWPALKASQQDNEQCDEDFEFYDYDSCVAAARHNKVLLKEFLAVLIELVESHSSIVIPDNHKKRMWLTGHVEYEYPCFTLRYKVRESTYTLFVTIHQGVWPPPKQPKLRVWYQVTTEVLGDNIQPMLDAERGKITVAPRSE